VKLHQTLAFVAGLGLCGVAAHRSQRVADEVRLDRQRNQANLFLPNGESLRVAALGQHTAVADLLWMRAVLRFAEIYDSEEHAGQQWLVANLDAVRVLDPGWRTVYFYGGAFLRVLDDIDGSDRLFLLGREALPDDAFFPFSLGMNAYLHRGDLEAAAGWLAEAAQRPNAPGWYAAAAASFAEQRGQRQAAVRYLDEEIARTPNPHVRARLEERRNHYVHEELVERIVQHRAGFRDRFGRDIVRVEELGALPPDPLGGSWILAPDGVVRSNVEEERVARKARTDERALLIQLGRAEAGRTPDAP
jgi:tetratricopeptide (TPR) repeat protein